MSELYLGEPQRKKRAPGTHPDYFYHRVRKLPGRLERARQRVEEAHAHLADVEAEARQYRFFDLLEERGREQ